MIRRWSHINTTNLIFSKFNKFEKKHKIIIFKASVNFKRFTFKLTKFRRKSIARFKHTSNWLIYTNVIKFWSIDYLFFRHFSKIQFFNKIFIGNSLIYNFNFNKIRNDLYSYNFNFFFSTWSQKSYFYFNKNFFNIKNNNITFIWYNQTPSLNNSLKLNYPLWDGLLYSQSLIKNDNLFSHSFDFNSIFDNILDLNLKYSIEIRKILILLFLTKIF